MAYTVDVGRQQQLEFARAGGAAYVNLKILDQPLRACSDADASRFFELLDSQFVTDMAVRAWVRYRESEVMFERFAVQAAKRRLGEAMDLARSSSEFDLYWMVVQHKLFYRMQQIYGQPEDWLRDALDVALVFANDPNCRRFQRPFADSVVQAVGIVIRGPFRVIGLQVRRFAAHWQEHAFLIVAFAIWRAATDARALTSSRAAVEAILRAEATFLDALDFD